MFKYLTSISLIVSMSVCASTKQAEITRKDLDQTLQVKSAKDRLQALMTSSACYQLVLDDKPMQRCACVHGDDSLTFLTEIACVYPNFMGIPMHQIHIKTKE